jgi:hypothetical protein
MLLGITWWPDYADHQPARLRRSLSGRITAITNWPHCGDHRVASLRRSLNGSIAPIINSAHKLLFVADGARWIWRCVGELIDSLGFMKWSIFTMPWNTLAEAADCKKNWKPSEEKRWLQKYRPLLFKGQTGAVIDAIRALCRGRNSKGISVERNFFIRKPAWYPLPNGQRAQSGNWKRGHGERHASSGQPSSGGRVDLLA